MILIVSTLKVKNKDDNTYTWVFAAIHLGHKYRML